MAWKAGALSFWYRCVLVSCWEHYGGLEGWRAQFLGGRILGVVWAGCMLGLISECFWRPGGCRFDFSQPAQPGCKPARQPASVCTVSSAGTLRFSDLRGAIPAQYCFDGSSRRPLLQHARGSNNILSPPAPPEARQRRRAGAQSLPQPSGVLMSASYQSQ